MRIAIVYPHVNNRGGVERYVCELSKIMARTHDVTLVAVSWDNDCRGGNKVIKIPFLSGPKFLLPLIFSFVSNLKLKRHTFDIVHVQGANCFKQDVITAHSCHKAWFVKSLKERNTWSAKWLLTLLNPLHYITIFIETLQYRKGNYKKIIAISNVVKKELISCYGLPGPNIEVVFNGTNCKEFHPGNRQLYAPEVRRKYNIRDDEIVVLFAANEFKRKGLEYLLQALSVLNERQIKLLVVGNGRADNYIKLSEKLSIPDNVIFAGPSQEMSKFYAASDIFVLPTEYEPFGLVITEAMASGLPVITSKYAGAAELVRDNYTGMLINDCGNPAEIAGLIRQLLNKDKRINMGTAARKQIEGFSWEATAQHVLQVYKMASELK